MTSGTHTVFLGQNYHVYELTQTYIPEHNEINNAIISN